MGKFKTAILQIIVGLLNGFGENLEKAINVLTMNLTDGTSMFSGVYDIAVQVSDDVIAPIASSIIGLCFFIEFMKISIKMDMFKWEYAITAMAKFAVAKSALDIAPDFLLAFYQKGSQLVTETANLVNTTQTVDTVATNVNNILASSTWYEALALAATMSLIFLAVWTVGVFVLVMAYARIFEIVLYISVAPLPVSFLPLENSQITKRFALNFVAVIIQGVIMLITILLFNAMITASDFTYDGSKNIFEQILPMAGNMLIATLCLITMIMKSGSIAKTVMGQN
jgi:hypothetical protein